MTENGYLTSAFTKVSTNDHLDWRYTEVHKRFYALLWVPYYYSVHNGAITQ